MFKKKKSIEYMTLESIMLAIDEFRVQIRNTTSEETAYSCSQAIHHLAEAYDLIKRGKKG